MDVRLPVTGNNKTSEKLFNDSLVEQIGFWSYKSFRHLRYDNNWL